MGTGGKRPEQRRNAGGRRQDHRYQCLKFAKGLGAHSYSENIYSLDSKYDEFYSTIGLDNQVGNNGSVVFEAYVDGVRLSKCGDVGNTGACFERVDLTGRQQLRLVVTDGGDGLGSDHADWADAHVLMNGGGVPSPPPTVELDPFLSDILWKSAKNGWGPAERKMSNGERAANVGRR